MNIGVSLGIKSYSKGAGGASSSPFITGITSLGALRSDYTGGVGLKFTVGAEDKTLTHLGRYVVPGNSQTHDIVLVDPARNILVSGTVNTDGATPDEIAYVAVAPYVLEVGEVYWLFSMETNGGDQWHNQTDSLVSVAAPFGLMVSGVTDNAISFLGPGTDANSPYGFPTFKFQ